MKDIKGYEGLYAVTEDGRVWSHYKKRFMKPTVLNNGYLQITLCKDGKREKQTIHRLVAEAYLDNPNNKPQVNHKDENKENNRVDNLEWCDSQYNNNYGNKNKTISKPVYCIELKRAFNSANEASKELDITGNHITCVCRGVRKTAGGYHWKYVEVS